MDELIGLMPAIKKSFSTIFKNENFGFLIKAAFTVVSIALLILLPIMLIFWGFLFVDSGITKQKTVNYENKYKNSYFETTESTSTNGVFRDSTISPKRPLSPDRPQADPRIFTRLMIFPFILIPLIILLSSFSMAFLIRTAWGIQEGKLENITSILKYSLKKILPMAGLSILLMLIMLVGFILFIIPGFIFMVMFMFSPYILIIENCGPLEALKRSKKLTAGYRANLFFKGVVFSLLVMVFFVPLFLVGFLSYYIGMSGVVSYTLNFVQQIILLSFYKDLVRIKGNSYKTSGLEVVTPSVPSSTISPTTSGEASTTVEQAPQV